MAPENRCPSCGQENLAGAAVCAYCNFPLREGPPEPLASDAGAPAPGGTPAAPPAEPLPAIDRRFVRPIRPRRPRDAQQQLQVQLTVILGGLTVVVTLLWVAWQGFQKNNAPPPAVEGANADQVATANLARGEIQRDSTNVNAQIALANVLYDTANWTEAIVHYRSAARLDPTRVTTIVDMGVCYYNLSDVPTAESLFTRALTLDPRQPVALFNLGIVAENRGEAQKALDFYHQAMRANPPGNMQQALDESMKRIMTKLGKKAPALGGAEGMPPASGGMPPGGGR